MNAKKYLIVVGGPTASGKTSTAIALARYYKTVILSADSRQFYREMSIGTAKPEANELAAAPHYFINSHSIQTPYSVGDFETEALALLRKLYQEKDIVVLAGGSGLYINALCQGLDHFPEVPKEVRDAYELKFTQEGIEALQQELREVDPAYAKKVDLQNPHRLIRALSVQQVSGQPFSSFLRKQSEDRAFHPIYLQMFWERATLYGRINRRVDIMLANGLEEEAKSLLPFREHSALATVGYQEWFDYFDGKTDRPTAIELIKRNSRRYAKRQMTWMRRDGFWKQWAPDDTQKIIEYTDWMLKQDYELETLDEDLKNIRFTYEEQVVASLSYAVYKQYAFAKVLAMVDTKALDYLIDEFNKVALEKDQFLIIPRSVELSLAESGYVVVDSNSNLPDPVEKLISEGEVVYFNPQK